jgi:hypothetical protein
VRESDRPERAASSETGARRLDESAAEEKRENTPNGLQRMKKFASAQLELGHLFFFASRSAQAV